MNHYEQSALVFYSEKNFLMSYNLFLDALSIDANNSMFWYGLGDSLCGYSNQKGVQNLYPIGISCIKKSLETNPANKYSSDMLERMKANPSIGEEYISKIDSLTIQQAKKLRIEIPTDKLIENYQSLRSTDNKIKAIMHLGETRNSKFASLLEYCILNEQNQTIRFAALKRIPFYQDTLDLKPMFDSLIADNRVEENEPYFSLAAGGIKKDWAQKILTSFKGKLSQKDEIDETKLNSLIQDEMLWMNLSMLLMKEDELKSMIANNQRKEIGNKISTLMKPNVIMDLQEKGVMNDQGSFTTIGMALLNKYLTTITPKQEIKDSPIQNKVNETNQTKKKDSGQNKKWWKIWQ